MLNPGTAPSVPAAPPSGPAPAPAAPEDPAWYDIPGQIGKALTNWFRDLLHDALSPVIDLLARTALVTPDLTAEPRIVAIWTITQGIANSAYVLLVVAGGVVVASHETLQTRSALKEIAPRIVAGFIGLNMSLSLVGEMVRLTNATAAALLGTDSNPDVVAERLKAQLFDGLDQAGIFMLLVALVVVVLAVVLLIVFVMRVALTVLLVSAAPLALACHALPATEGAARLWWRSLLGVLTIQLAQALTLIVALQVFFTPAGLGGFGGGGVLMDLVVTLVMVWVLVRIPSWVGRFIFGSRPSTLSTLVKYAVLSRALGRVGLGRGGARRAVAGRVAAGRSGVNGSGGLARGTWSGRAAPVLLRNRRTAAQPGPAHPRPAARRHGTATSSVPAEYPAASGNRAAEQAKWWGAPTFRAPGTRPPVGPPRFQPARPTTPRHAPSRPVSASRTVRPASATPLFSTGPRSTTPRTVTATPDRAVSTAATFSAAASPPAPVARGGSPAATFRPPVAPPTTAAAPTPAAPEGRRRGTGRAWIPPTDQRRP